MGRAGGLDIGYGIVVCLVDIRDGGWGVAEGGIYELAISMFGLLEVFGRCGEGICRREELGMRDAVLDAAVQVQVVGKINAERQLDWEGLNQNYEKYNFRRVHWWKPGRMVGKSGRCLGRGFGCYSTRRVFL